MTTGQDKPEGNTFVTFDCASCGSTTTLHDVMTATPDGLCPPCHFFGPDWEEDENLVKIVDDMQNRNCQ